MQRDGGERGRRLRRPMGRGCLLRSWSLHRHGRQGGGGRILGALMMKMWPLLSEKDDLRYFDSIRVSSVVLDAIDSRLAGLLGQSRIALWCLHCHRPEVCAAGWRRDECWVGGWYHSGPNCLLLRTRPPRRWI